MNWLDVVLGIILFTTGFAGLKRGFARSIFGTVSTLAALFLGMWFYEPAGSLFTEFVSHKSVANFLGFMLVFALTTAAGALAGWFTARTMKAVGLGWLDRILGTALGLFRGTIVCIGVILIVSAFTKKPPPAAVAQSQIAPYVMGASSVLSKLAPQDMRKSFDETYKKVKELWYGVKPSSV